MDTTRSAPTTFSRPCRLPPDERSPRRRPIALEFLQAQGFVHRIESLNAFVGCHDPGRPHAVQFMICRECRTAVEIHDPRIADALAAAAAAVGFTPQERVVELSGLCARCAPPRDGSPAPA